MIIALDAMGGDLAPDSTVLGALEFLNQSDSGSVHINLFGDQDVIKPILETSSFDTSNISIIHCSDIIDMNDRSAKVFRDKPESSLVKAVLAVKNKEAQAVVSAGNTGALLTSSLFLLGKIEGINRPALAPFIPTQSGGFILCDAGANADVKPKHLVHFGIMASAFMEHLKGKTKPNVALLNIGSEELKGNELTKQAYPLIEKHIPNFIGNIESRYILDGKADIIICDGFVGNTILKLIEGMIKHIFSWINDSIQKKSSSKLIAPMIKPIFKDLKSNLDYEEHGSTPFLGVNGIVMKCHGSSSAKSIKNALISAEKAYHENLIEDIAERISNHLLLKQENA